MTGAGGVPPCRSEERHDEAPGVVIGSEPDAEEWVSVAIACPGDRGLAFGWEPVSAIPGHVDRLAPGGVLVVLRAPASAIGE